MSPAPLLLFGVTHLVRATRRHAANLEELRAGIADATRESLFYHAMQHRLRDATGEDLPPDDFSTWVRGVVQHPETAERLEFAVLQNRDHPEATRQAIGEVLAEIPEQSRIDRDSPTGGSFEFLASESVVLPWDPPVMSSHELYDALAAADTGVWFWHFIEEPWMTGLEPSPVTWLRELGETRLAEMLKTETAKPSSLEQMSRSTLARWRRLAFPARLAAASGMTESERREVGRQTIAGLVRRVRRGGDGS